MKIYFTLALIAQSLLALSNVYAQISFSTKGETYYDDNIFNNALKTGDMVSSISLSTAYDIESERNNLQLYYMNNFSYFRENIFKSSNSHKFGAVNTYLLSEDGNPLNIGINYSVRNNRDEFYIFDFNQISLYSNYRHSLDENNYFIIGYLFNSNKYKNLSMFSYYENKAFLKYSSTFSTGTAFMGGAEINLKNYAESSTEYGGTNNSSQLNLYLQVSQSLAKHTGLSGYFLQRLNLQSGSRYINSGDYIYYEEEILNDIYSNDGYETGISLTQILSNKFTVKFEFAYSTKNFSGLPAAGAEGYDLNENRSDKLFSAGIQLEADLSSFIYGLNTSANWNFIKNNSNDGFYNFDNQIFSFGLGWEF